MVNPFPGKLHRHSDIQDQNILSETFSGIPYVSENPEITNAD